MRFLQFATMAAVILLGAAAQDDGDSSATLNVCISPRACFTVDAHPETQYCIGTEWHITYDKHLRSKIFSPVQHPGTTPLIAPSGCGWSHAFDVSAKSVSRGAVYYRVPDNGSFDYPPTLEADTAVARQIMLNTYPGVEIALILIFTIGLPVLFVLAVCFCCCMGALIDRYRAHSRKRAAAKALNRQQKQEAKAKQVLEKEKKERNRVSADTLTFNGTEKLPDSASGSMV